MANKVAVVTGSSRGIGKQIAITLSENGYDVVVNYYNDKACAEEVCERVRRSGRKCICIKADVGKMDEVQGMFDCIFEEFGQVDLLVNNAGISYEAPFLEASEEFFDKMTSVDWKAVFFSSQIVANKMVEKNIRGTIINIASNQVYGCWPGASVYAPSKAAVVQFTKNAAMELSHHGIRMVAVAPGYTDVGWPEDDIRHEAASRLPLRRFATTKEVAEAVLYLASDKAGYITGTCLTIDGGATLPVVAKNDFVD